MTATVTSIAAKRNSKTKMAEDEQAIWDTFSAGGEYGHNLVQLRLMEFDRKYGKTEAHRVYAELIEAGY